jgi:diguanylate cyclase (GGDEF)-like protein
MQIPNMPENEELRLRNLYSLNILDTQAEERFDRLTRLAKRMFNVPIALVSIVDKKRQWFKSKIGVDVTETERDISFCGHAILDGKTFIIDDAKEDHRFADNPLVISEPYIRFYAGCPLKHLDGTALGTLCIIDTKPRNFDKEDLKVLEDLAELAERELAAFQLATLDDLTKISNRRGFVTLAQKSIDLCERQKIPVSLVYFDLNDFKEINDNFGHAEGDRALIIFAEQMRSRFRDSDVIARLGGDEFVVLLTNTDKERAEEVIAEFQQSIDHYNDELAIGYNISFCYGVVTIGNTDRKSVEDLLQNADNSMYKKKHKRISSKN